MYDCMCNVCCVCIVWCCMWVCICVCMYVCLCVFMCVYLCVCMCIMCVCVYVYVCGCVCECVFVCVCMYIHIHTHPYTSLGWRLCVDVVAWGSTSGCNKATKVDLGVSTVDIRVLTFLIGRVNAPASMSTSEHRRLMLERWPSTKAPHHCYTTQEQHPMCTLHVCRNSVPTCALSCA